MQSIFYFYIENLVLWTGQSSLALPWSFVSKITNSKHPAKRTAGRQITNKFQIPIFNDQNLPGREIVFVWDLLFGISISQSTFNNPNPLWV